MASPHAAPEPATDLQAAPAFDIVLKALSHPELDDIRIDDSLFAIGRSEAPFIDYPPEITGELSRRHARIFSEFGAVYIADLDSKNGTTVNGTPVRQKPCKLKDGDEICLGKTLSFRLRLTPGSGRRGVSKLRSLTLTPENAELGLQPLVVAHFPFLVGKTDHAFAQYRKDYPHQVNYISRRHAHIFLKNGQPYVEDLGSTNGTFIGSERLDEHAAALHDGDLLAFGGHHLVYRVGLQHEAVNDPTLTRLSTVAGAEAADTDKTTFVAAADSFLDIFCVDHETPPDEAADDDPADAAAEAPEEGTPARRPGRFAILATELKEALAGDRPLASKRAVIWAGALAAGVVLLSLAAYFNGRPERQLKDLLADGAYMQAASQAQHLLESHPDNAELRTLGTEALLKATVPNWLALIGKQDFDGAAAAVATMRDLGHGNRDATPLIAELAWVGALEQLVASRGSGEAPIRIYADEEKMTALLTQWEDDVQGHQRAYTAIAAAVPAFRDRYTEALSHLRKLQSDNSVYLAAIARLKTSIASELAGDKPEVLDAVFTEYADKYPRLGGIDALRDDLHRFLDLRRQLQAGTLGPLVTLLSRLHFATPPFRERLQAMAATGQLPPPDVISHVQAVAAAWHKGESQAALDGLQKLAGGPWAAAAARDAEHKKAVAARYAELQQLRGDKTYNDHLLAFYGALDPNEDSYFIDATATELASIKDQALHRAQDLLKLAQTRWRQYLDQGAIEGAQRLEREISGEFRSQAKLLAEAGDDALQGMRIYRQLKVDIPPEWQDVETGIRAETDLQRNALSALRPVLDPQVLKAKLELIGGRSDGQSESP